ncbi:hypothetical protein SAMD00019534_059150 [Acytostelium subglobosum LB1]|uniref:hypothetical protein n=1 Tax=Acytostelium subglobosum LB1 TaxID=1410327 RepID=UPI000644EDE0|nr:hypothetical protein SAMD00019534_059150 [Acytostelium subglobosum LB1]GAM22740.1 hypothetical protein SAMD00019534_059150 [Acytostelium subglobosum LB1]|eukprot:XP_012753967.1 hypothetical protein SAMD00019534_059150 [Acytostelium subglobosum LB1]
MSCFEQIPCHILRQIVVDVNDTFSCLSISMISDPLTGLRTYMHQMFDSHLNQFMNNGYITPGSYFVVAPDMFSAPSKPTPRSKTKSKAKPKTKVIPPGTIYLFFSDEFNQILRTGDIPSSVEYVSFGKNFNQPLTPGIIPNSVKTLMVDEDFNQQLVIGSIPSSVTSLHLLNGSGPNHQVGSIPNSVTELFLTTRWLPVGLIPISVTHLDLQYDGSCGPCAPGAIPESVTNLSFRYYADPSITFGSIPTSVEELTLVGTIPSHHGLIPDSVKRLITFNEFPNNFLVVLGEHEIELPKPCPDSFKQFITSGDQSFNQPITGIISNGLTSLVFPASFNQIIQPGDISSSVIRIKFSPNSYFNQLLIPGSLPSSLTSLKFGTMFDQYLDPGIIPSTVSTLYFDSGFTQSLPVESFPASLRRLKIPYQVNIPRGLHPLSVLHLVLSDNDDDPSHFFEYFDSGVTNMYTITLGKFYFEHKVVIIPQFDQQWSLVLKPNLTCSGFIPRNKLESYLDELMSAVSALEIITEEFTELPVLEEGTEIGPWSWIVPDTLSPMDDDDSIE